MNKISLQLTHSGRRLTDKSFKGTVISPTESRLYFILSGSFVIVSPNNEKTVLSQGNSYLIPSGYSFDYYCPDEMDHVFFHVTLTAFDGLDLLRSVERPISRPFESIPEDVFRFKTIVESLKTEAFITASLHALLLENNMNLDTNPYSKEVKKAMEYVQRNLSVQLSVKDIAKNAFTAPSTLSRKFRKETSMSPGEYLDSMVFREAKRLLKSGKHSILEISERLGFSDQFYFSRRFTEKYGVPPSKYRRSHLDI
jgi:AraC-like DNA-binding protein